MDCKFFKFFLIKLLVIIFLVTSCSQRQHSRTEIALGTICSVTLYEDGHFIIYEEIFNRINEIENLMSVNIADSDISRINAAAGMAPVIVHKDTFFVIEQAVYYAELTGGAFDPSVGAIVSLWGIGGINQRLPSNEEIETALPLVNFNNIILDKESNSVFLTQKGMALDLGAIAKGYAVDETVKIIKNAGIKRAKIDLGGDIYMLGERKDRAPWRVGVQNPDGDQGEIIGFIQVKDSSIVTSGTYQRFFIKDGIRYHHIIDTKTGYPVQNDLVSITIIMSSAMEADALSTAAFVLGYNNAKLLFDKIPAISALYVFNDDSVITDGIDFTLLKSTTPP
ncbi:MAG: FAD:protein FMN transferase [Treponema sp.]|nr:FAD:protein FMN transferase [Treponema sp.]